MAHRIEVSHLIEDARARVRQNKLKQHGIKSVFIVDVYTIDKSLKEAQLKSVANIFANPVTQQALIDTFNAYRLFNYAIEIGYLPGVTDNIGNTAKEAIEDLLEIKFKPNENIYSSQITFIQGEISKEKALKIGHGLANILIQRVHIKDYQQYLHSKDMDILLPKVTLENKTAVSNVDLNVSDEELQLIGKSGIANTDGTRRGPLALDLNYMKAIQNYFIKLKRNPTDLELESIAQTWSEHCKHTIFADPIDDIKEGLYKTYIKAATNLIRKNKGRKDFCTSVFTDNSGAIEFDDQYLITHKVETHNSPSALDPFGGAITGIVGVNRDAIGFGLGAKPVINTYGFCFSEPETTRKLYKDPNLTQEILSPRRIIDGVIEGVNSGGNCSGIPTPQGFVFFNQRYQGKPLVFVGTVGLIPKKISKKCGYKKKAQPGDYIVVIGGRVGKDGIHGATFSSEALNTGSPATAVQIGDPITQKKLSDALIKEIRALNLYNSITDNGAGGLSCSVAEMAKETGGFRVSLEKVPLKYPGLKPWEIWISESQERMTLSIPKTKWKKFYSFMKRRGVEATRIGTFTSSKKCIVTYKGKKIMNMDMNFLHNGLPSRHLKTISLAQIHKQQVVPSKNNLTQEFISILKRLNITSFEFISSQYDHEVQGGSVLKPLQGKGRVNADATVVQPLLSSAKGVAISQGMAPAYSDINAYHMAACSIDTAIRNLIAVGANPDKIALLDNFCWCSSNEPERLGQLKIATQACYDYAVAFNTPFISGKDSMFNDFKGFDERGNPIKISIPPTLLISSIALVNDVTKTISLEAKFPGDLIYVLGDTKDELGASEYFDMKKYYGGNVPQVDAATNLKLYRALFKCTEEEIISSAISVNRGGLAVALAKISIGGLLGIDISLKNLPGSVSRNDFALFSESQGRIIATINPENKDKFEKNIRGNSFAHIGKVTENNQIIIKGKSGDIIVKAKLDDILKSYKSTFKNY